MKSIDEVGITFANMVVGRGVMNGVINIQLGAYLFSAKETNEIDPDLSITARIRMDEPCARQLRDQLDELLRMIDTERQAQHLNGSQPHVETESLN